MATGIHRPPHTINQGQELHTDTSDDESADMENIGDLLEEALCVYHESETSPSPAKKAKDNYQSPQVNKSSCIIHSLGFTLLWVQCVFHRHLVFILDQKCG
jgi:hypothetical protein